jgi:chemotaxis protein MotB
MVLVLAMLAGTGCVSQVQYDDLMNQYRQAKERNTDLEGQLNQANADLKALREAQNTADADLRMQLAKALKDNAAMKDALADAEAQLRRLQGGIAGPLPEELSKDLQDLADAYPDVLTFDRKRGMVKLAADMTFASGSVEVKPAAAAALAKLAAIIDSPVAANFEAQIIGHTDNVRIARPETLAKHPTNWHLSVHRAIAVKDVLEKSGVGPARMMVGGYSQYRPVAPNIGKKGAEANRRVEIYLVHSTASGVDSGAPADAEAGPAAEPAPKADAPKPVGPTGGGPRGPKPGDELYK